MPLLRSLALVLLLTSAARAAELRTLKGEVITGDLVSITDKEIVLDAAGKKVATPVTDILQVDFKPAPRQSAELPFLDVELTDGTLLHTDPKSFVLKGKQVELTLLAGQQVRLDLAAVANVLVGAQDAALRKDWTERLARKRRRDVLALLKEGVPNLLEGTLGEGDEAGKSIDFTLSSGRKIAVPLANVHGLIFQREPDPTAAPVICRLHDTARNLVEVSGFTQTPGGFRVTTPAGARIDYDTAQVSRLDYSRGKLTYLSDLDPVKVVENSTEERVEHYRRDKNLDDGPLRLAGTTYARGLALHAYTELEYDLKGEYREFKTIAGIDDAVGGDPGPTQLRVEGDGKELLTLSFTRKDKERVRPVTLNVKDVQRLRLVVRSGSFLDLGRHLDLADAKVSK